MRGLVVRHPLCPILVGLLVVAGCATKLQPPPGRLVHGRYLLTDTGQFDSFTEPAERNKLAAALAAGGGTGDEFAGTDRGDAKTSIASGDPETYQTVAALRSSLPSDEDMLDKHISRDASSPRVAEEEHNVRVAAYIYAIHKENDNDFHLIIGDEGCDEGPCLMTAEVSGLPPSDAAGYDALVAARQQFLAYFGGHQPGTGNGYAKSKPPIPIMITGSVFFDVDHRAGVVGPQGMRPNSAWEIHPVTKISFTGQ